MDAQATAKFLLVSPRKVRLVANEIRGYPYNEAMDILRFIPRKGADMLKSVLASARANANVKDENLTDDRLFIKKVYIDGGPTLRRYRPRARGRATQRLKRISHITVVLSDEA